MRVIHTLGEELESHRDTVVTGKQPRTQIDTCEMTNAQRVHTHGCAVLHMRRHWSRGGSTSCISSTWQGNGFTLSPSVSPGPSGSSQQGRAGGGEVGTAAPCPTGCEGAEFTPDSHTRPRWAAHWKGCSNYPLIRQFSSLHSCQQTTVISTVGAAFELAVLAKEASSLPRSPVRQVLPRPSGLPNPPGPGPRCLQVCECGLPCVSKYFDFTPNPGKLRGCM